MSAELATKTPRVTLIVTQRERMALSERSLENILADQSEPFRLIYVDGGAPEAVHAYLERRAGEMGFRLIRRAETLWPNVARNLALPFVDTEYTCFIDNDVIVEDGWLARLVACADETGAAIVGPLYLIGGGGRSSKIHMAGGEVRVVETAQGTTLHEQHLHMDAPLAERAACRREPCDYAEFHCMLVRTEFVRGRLSEDILSVHEHVDLGLEAKRVGLPVFVEPSAAVTYLAFEPMRASDLALYRQRWNLETANESLVAFSEKWNFVDDGEVYKGVRHFLRNQLANVDPVWHRRPARGVQPPASASDIRQNLYGLLTQAAARGYQGPAVAKFSQAYYAAITLFDGGYRACGRPFISHCVGTASALVHFGFAPRLVIAGMLHAAYSHAAVGSAPHAAFAVLEKQIKAAFGDPVEDAVRNYARFQDARDSWRDARPAAAMLLRDAEIAAIAIANEIDEWASGEALMVQTKQTLTPEWRGYFEEVAQALDVPAFAATLTTLAQTTPPTGFNMRSAQQESYRLRQGGLVKMANGAFAAWDRDQTATRLSA